MAQIITFLGKGGIGRTTVAIAAAKQLASQGSRVLLAVSDSTPGFNILLGASVSAEPQEIGANLKAVNFQSTVLLEKAWEEAKNLEAQYLRSPTLKNVYGQELSILPGMDGALALNAIREYNNSGQYDVIVYDGSGDITTLRMLGIPETVSWYIRRFRQVFIDSDLGKAISPFIQPVSSAIFNNSGWISENFGQQPTNQAQNMLEQGKQAMADPQQLAAYLVTDDSPAAISTAKYLWGSAQQINLTVAGVLSRANLETVVSEFSPLPVTTLPSISEGDWQPLIDALPNFRKTPEVPAPISIDLASRQVRVFLPSFDKKQVKLTQYGPEITIEAGDQRRNIVLPPSLSGQTVQGAKFQDGYLVISL